MVTCVPVRVIRVNRALGPQFRSFSTKILLGLPNVLTELLCSRQPSWFMLIFMMCYLLLVYWVRVRHGQNWLWSRGARHHVSVESVRTWSPAESECVCYILWIKLHIHIRSHIGGRPASIYLWQVSTHCVMRDSLRKYRGPSRLVSCRTSSHSRLVSPRRNT